ncbi:Transmembrane anterior posterior transformation protein 1 [Balamuthia mandrillaris]
MEDDIVGAAPPGAPGHSNKGRNHRRRQKAGSGPIASSTSSSCSPRRPKLALLKTLSEKTLPFTKTHAFQALPTPDLSALPEAAHRLEYRYLDEEKDYEPLLPPKVKNPGNATDFVFVPYTLERMILYGMFICLDSFLFVFTVLPIRAVIALWKLIVGKKLHAIQKVDLLKMMLIVMGFLLLRLLDIPRLSNFIRKESLLKLKILFTLLELMDRLLCSYGLNILGSLFWAVNQPLERVKRGYTWHFVLAIIYTAVHSTFLLFHIAVLDVAMAGKNNTLLTLLILVQFAEMKSAVLKEFDEKKLYDMSCGDITERFQLIVYLVLLFFHNMDKHSNDSIWDLGFAIMRTAWMKPLLVALSIVYVSELLVDWIKHTSVINFGSLSANIYTKFSYKLSHKLSNVPSADFLTDRTQTVARDMGMMPLPLAILVLKVMSDWMPDAFSLVSIVTVAVCYALLLLLRILSGYILCLFIQSYSGRNRRSSTVSKLFLLGKKHEDWSKED